MRYRSSIDRSDVVSLVKLLVHGGDGRNTGGGTVEVTCCSARCLGLHVQKARHDLQAVFDAVVDLLDQQVFLPSAFLKCALCLLEFLPLV